MKQLFIDSAAESIDSAEVADANELFDAMEQNGTQEALYVSRGGRLFKIEKIGDL